MKHLVEISNQFKSSARVTESNFEPRRFLANFIAHGTVLQTLDNLGAEISGTQQRTFTVTGPYGSGKSTLALYLSCLLSEDTNICTQALNAMGVGSSSYDQFKKSFPCESGWVVVKHLCALTSPVHGITASILQAIGCDTTGVDSLTEDQCLHAIKDGLKEASVRKDGVVIIVDELGKALDYLSSIGGDLHFFQSFADLVQEFDNVVVIGFLHQSFAAYAKGRDTRTQNEWGKVQGRYKDFGFNPSIEESLYLVSKSFTVESSLQKQLQGRASKTLDVVANHFLVGQRNVLENVLPLDPVVGLLLGPISKRSFSQNERSLFSFIATHENYGFRDFVKRESLKEAKFESLYRIDSLWDYLYHNLGHIISASGDSKTWLEACDAVERANTLGDGIHSFITKLVALLSMVGRGSKLFASRQFIIDYMLSLPEHSYAEEDVSEALSFLESKSIVIYRHNLNSYQIFRASDLDINRLILDWIERVKGGVDWVAHCDSEKLILANAHYHRTGTMRWVETQVVSSIDQVKEPTGLVGSSFANFVLPTNLELYQELCDRFDHSDFIVMGTPDRIDELEQATIELIALEKIAKEESEKLSRDPIAKTEIENRDKLARLRIAKVLDQILQSVKWRYKGSALSGGSLTAKVSRVADEIYSDCPAVHNELVNRMKLSGTANSALNKLMIAILYEDTEEQLDLPTDTFPPEKGIYLSCLRAKGWHTPQMSQSFAGNWIHCNQSSELADNERDVFKLWQAGFEFIKARGDLVVIKELYEFWMSPPFGLTLGLCKLYGMALLKSLESNLAFYDFDSTKDWIYIPELDEELVTKFIRYPAEAGVRFYELAETDMLLVHQIADASESMDKESILATARSLVRQMHALPSWVKRTSGKNLFEVGGDEHLDSLTKRFRDKVLSAKDPYKLILEDIPSLFQNANDLTEGLRETMKGLMEIDSVLSNQFKVTVTRLIDEEPGEALTSRCEAVAKAASRPEIENFAKRLKFWSENPTQTRLEELISLVIGVRKESWTDERISEGYDKVRELCIQFKRYETFTRASGRVGSGTRPVALIFENAIGETLELEQFISDGNVESSHLSKSRSAIESQLKDFSDAERVRILVELLAKEMKPVGSEAK
jgi:energy-coupling factor transporter ATP-binding protein EcfA2